MHTSEVQPLTIPPHAVANAAYPFDEQVARARRFLAERGIREVRPLYSIGRTRLRRAISSSTRPARSELHGPTAGGGTGRGLLEETAA